MRIYTKAIGSVVLWKNPRNLPEEWEPVTNFCSVEAANRAVQYYGSREFRGWTTTKLSKSNEAH